MTAQPRIAQVTVESLGGLGDGIATLNGKPLFIPKSVAGDVVNIAIIHENSSGYMGRITELVSPGPLRGNAPCPYFNSCGGCGLQQLTDEAYRSFKQRILDNALSHAGFAGTKAELHFLPPETRRRVEFKLHHDNGRIFPAFHALRSHTTVPIEHCLILKPQLQVMIAPLSRALSAYPMASHIYAVSLTLADSGIDMELTFKNVDLVKLPPLDAMAESLGVARISVGLHEQPPRIACERSPVEMNLGGHAVPLPPGAFLQAAPEAQQLLTNAVLEGVGEYDTVVDLFCGIGTYSFPLAATRTVHAVEGDEAMVNSIRAAAKRHGLKQLTAARRDLFKSPITAGELASYKAAVINPPRAGAKAQTVELAKSNIKRVVMVSCNPATFARDAKHLRDAGFILASALGVDQFVWSQHLEIVSVFTR